MSKTNFVEVVVDGEIKTVIMNEAEFECFNYGVEVGRVELLKELKDAEMEQKGEVNSIYQRGYSDGYQQGRADMIEELLSIKNPCDDCYMEFCETCRHNGEYSANIQAKLEQLKEQK